VGGANSKRDQRLHRGTADQGIQLIVEEVERIFREERGRLAAGLIRRSGSFDLAEEALQDAFASALQAWPDEGVPRNPGAWITAVAFRKLIDRVRREKRYAALDTSFDVEALMLTEEFEDDRLRLMFTCCHPARAPWAVSRRPRSPAPFRFPKRRWRSAWCGRSARSPTRGFLIRSCARPVE
jgi:sigma-70-like protein